MNYSVWYNSQSETKTTLHNIYYSKKHWQEKFGNYLFIEYLFIFLLAPCSSIGFFFNLLSLKVFNSRCFLTKNIYKYIRIYLIIGTIICFIFSFNFLIKTPSILNFANTYTARFLGIKILFPIFAVLYFNLSILDIYISLERLSHLDTKFGVFKRFNPQKVCMLLLILSTIINFVYIFFTYKPGSFYVQLLNYTIYFNDLTQFGRSKFGQINILFVYITRDVVILLIVMGLNIFIVRLLNNYSKNKKEMNIKSEKLMLINKKNKKITIMVIAMIISSSLEHSIFIITYVYYIISQDQYASTICNFVSLIGIILKQISNFFIFYFYNYMFRMRAKRFLDYFRVQFYFYSNKQP